MNLDYSGPRQNPDGFIGRNGIRELVSWSCGQDFNSSSSSKEFEVE